MNITKAFGLDETQNHSAEYNGVKFSFEAKKHTRTPRFMQRCVDSERGNPEQLPKALSEVLTAWDITRDDGSPWPITEAELSRLPMPFLNVIVNTIIEAWPVNKKEVK
jgi:hypothetical protein